MTDVGTAMPQPPRGRGGRHRRRRGQSMPARPSSPGVNGATAASAATTDAVTADTVAHGALTTGAVAGGGTTAAVVAAPPPPTGRAGRNLPLAIGVGLLLGALVLVPLFVYRLAFVGVLAAAVVVGIWEVVRAIQPVEARPPMIPLIVGGLGMVGMAWAAGAEALLLGLVLTVVAVVVWRIPDGPIGFQRDVTAASLVACYVPFLASFAVLLVTPDDGVRRIIAFIATVVCSDVGGYAAGVLIGRHPLAPTVSPKKSWEGLGGSVPSPGSASSFSSSTGRGGRARCSASRSPSRPRWVTLPSR